MVGTRFDSPLRKKKLPMKRQASSSSQQQEGELKCPRCESTKTKFCYYNNYNKSQPRHFCKACKRHWTNGGTLRNVPIGGGRKNKRKAPNTTTKTTSKTNIPTSSTTSKGVSNNNMTIQGQNLSKEEATGANELVDEVGSEYPAFYEKDGIFVGPQDMRYPYTNLGIFESISSSISSTILPSIQSPSTIYNSLEERVMNNSMSSSSMRDNNMSMSSWSMDVGPTSSSNWSWDDFDKFVSVEADVITIPWDDPEIKP